MILKGKERDAEVWSGREDWLSIRMELSGKNSLQFLISDTPAREQEAGACNEHTESVELRADRSLVIPLFFWGRHRRSKTPPEAASG